MNLDLVLGLSCNNISCLTCDRTSSLVAHTASGVLVLLDTQTNCQVKYLQLRRNAVSSANFSPDGKFIVTGEIGYRPAVRVWRIRDGQEVATMYGHEFGIKSVLFCPTMEEIISVGLEHDNEVNVWAWPDKHRLATNKIVDVIRAVAYSECGRYFVTAGTRHLKFWYPKLTLSEVFHTAVPIVQPLYGRPGILGDCKQHTFIDVACGNGVSASLVYTITKAGGLIILNANDRRLRCHKNIEQFQATCLMAQDRILFIGFSSGDIHMFNSLNLVHLAALPVPTFFRRTGLNGGGVFTLTFNPCTTLLTTAYQNSSMCIWDLQDAENVKQKYVAVYHSRAIANLDIFTSMDPGGRIRETLVTVSHDSSVRMWGIVIANSICYDRLSILYTDATSPAVTTDSEEAVMDHASIITAVKVSPDKKHIVTGNKAGNICVYDRDTYEHTLTVMAHNREVTCLAFYCDSCSRTVLVSGSRDRLIHIMDVNNYFKLISTLNIHSSSITALAICEADGAVCMISCAADRSLSICTTPLIDGTSSKRPPYFQLSRCATSVSTPSDIAVDLNTAHMAVGCQDGYVRVFDIALLQERRMFRGCSSEEGQIQKICLDQMGILLLTAASDRTINIINFCMGEILITLSGHSKCVTGLTFTSGGDHVISTSMDGCVFIWRLSEKLLLKRKEICYCLETQKINKSNEETCCSSLAGLLTNEGLEQQPSKGQNISSSSTSAGGEAFVAYHSLGETSQGSKGRRMSGSVERLVAAKRLSHASSASVPDASVKRPLTRATPGGSKCHRVRQCLEKIADIKQSQEDSAEPTDNLSWNKAGEVEEKFLEYPTDKSQPCKTELRLQQNDSYSPFIPKDKKKSVVPDSGVILSETTPISRRDMVYNEQEDHLWSKYTADSLQSVIQIEMNGMIMKHSEKRFSCFKCHRHRGCHKKEARVRAASKDKGITRILKLHHKTICQDIDHTSNTFKLKDVVSNVQKHSSCSGWTRLKVKKAAFSSLTRGAELRGNHSSFSAHFINDINTSNYAAKQGFMNDVRHEMQDLSFEQWKDQVIRDHIKVPSEEDDEVTIENDTVIIKAGMSNVQALIDDSKVAMKNANKEKVFKCINNTDKIKHFTKVNTTPSPTYLDNEVQNSANTWQQLFLDSVEAIDHSDRFDNEWDEDDSHFGYYPRVSSSFPPSVYEDEERQARSPLCV